MILWIESKFCTVSEITSFEYLTRRTHQLHLLHSPESCLAYTQGQPTNTKVLKSIIFSRDEVLTAPTATVCVAIAATEPDAVETDMATATPMVPRR